MKKLLFCTVLVVAVFLAASSAPAESHSWKVRLPSDLPFDHCHIFFYNDGGSDTGAKEIARGSSANWGSNTSLSYIGGKCTIHNTGGDQEWRLQSRSCTGVDYTSGIEGGIRCDTKLLTLKICPKVTLPILFPRDYQYGFCPDE